MLPIWARVDLGTKAVKGYSTFPRAPALLETHHQIVLCHIYYAFCLNVVQGHEMVLCHIRTLIVVMGAYSSAEKQSVYSIGCFRNCVLYLQSPLVDYNPMDLYFKSSRDIFHSKFFWFSRYFLIRCGSAIDFTKVKEKSKIQRPVTGSHKSSPFLISVTGN